MSAPQSWVDVARLRQGLYRFYGAALLEPAAERLTALAAATGYLDTLGVEAFAYATTWAEVHRVMQSEVSSDTLRREHARLFGSGVDGAPAPAMESFYAGPADQGKVGTSLASLERDYRSLGVAPAPFGSVSPDHVSTELEVLALLCAREGSAWEREDHVGALSELRHQDRFLRSHLSSWLPLFLRRVVDARPAPFYLAVVEATAAMVSHDLGFVGALLAQGEGP